MAQSELTGSVGVDVRTAPEGVGEGPRGTLDFTMDYRDYHGERHERRVSIDGLNVKGGRVTLSGYCHLRRQPRHFRLDRIEAIVTEDGEVLPPHDLRSFFMGVALRGGADLGDMERVNGPIQPRLLPDRTRQPNPPRQELRPATEGWLPAQSREPPPRERRREPMFPWMDEPDDDKADPSIWTMTGIVIAVFLAVIAGMMLLAR